MESQPPEILEKNQKGRVCTKCKLFKIWELFPLDKRLKDGHKARCKACRRLASDTYYRNNPTQKNAEYRLWKEKNPQYYRDYKKKNPDIISVIKKRYAQSHPEVQRAANKRLRARDPDSYKEKARIAKRKFRLEHPEIAQEQQKRNGMSHFKVVTK